MARQRHLANAPIREAIIDLRVKLPAGFEVDTFRASHERLRESYPVIEERRLFQDEMQLKGGQVVSRHTQEGLHGFFFKSEDEQNLVQFRVDGFTFNRLKPYTAWKEVFCEARKLWGVYTEICEPESITRIAVRYINHLVIPDAVSRIKEYLTAPPAIPDGLPQIMKRFLTRVVIDDPGSNLTANIIQALEQIVDSSRFTVILDIDVFREELFGIHDDQIWPIFEEMRNLKNHVFFNSLTEKAVRLFE